MNCVTEVLGLLRYCTAPTVEMVAKARRTEEHLSKLKEAGTRHTEKAKKANQNALRKIGQAASAKEVARARGIGYETTRKMLMADDDIVSLQGMDAFGETTTLFWFKET